MMGTRDTMIVLKEDRRKLQLKTKCDCYVTEEDCKMKSSNCISITVMDNYVLGSNMKDTPL